MPAARPAIAKFFPVVLVLLGLGAGRLAAQETRFFWGPEAYPHYAAPRLISLGNLTQGQVDSLQAREVGRPGYSVGANAGWIGQKVGFRFGLRFAETGYRTVREPFPADQPDPDGALERREIHTQYQLEVPLSLDFSHWLDARNRFAFSMGLAAGLHLGARSTEVRYFGDTSNRQPLEDAPGPYRTVSAAFLAGMGWETFLNDNLSLSLSPTFQFWLSPLLQDAAVNRSLYSVGINLGLRFYRP